MNPETNPISPPKIKPLELDVTVLWKPFTSSFFLEIFNNKNVSIIQTTNPGHIKSFLLKQLKPSEIPSIKYKIGTLCPNENEINENNTLSHPLRRIVIKTPIPNKILVHILF